MAEDKKEVSVSKGTVKIKITDPAGWIYEGVHYLEGRTLEIPESVHKSITEAKVKTVLVG